MSNHENFSSHRKWIKAQLEKGKTTSRVHALVFGSVGNITGRVCELRKSGLDITTHMVKHSFNKKVEFGIYSLSKNPPNAKTILYHSNLTDLIRSRIDALDENNADDLALD